MTRSRITTLALVAVAMFAALMLVVGCGSSSTKTLESYFKSNQSEWNSAVQQIKESGGDVLDVDMSVSGNKISQIMTFKQTYSADQVNTIKANLESQLDSLTTTVAQQIKAMEQETGITGITWLFDYRNGDGKTILSTEVKGS